MSHAQEHTPESSASLMSVFLSSHDELWSQMRAIDAPMLRFVMVKAAELERAQGEVARMAFLSGVAIAHAAERVAEAEAQGRIPSIEQELAALDQAS